MTGQGHITTPLSIRSHGELNNLFFKLFGVQSGYSDKQTATSHTDAVCKLNVINNVWVGFF